MERTSETLFMELEEWGCAVKETKERLLQDDERYILYLKRLVCGKEHQQISSLLIDGEYDEAYKLVHTQRGVTANLGLTPLYQSLSLLMEKLKAQKYEECMEEYRQVSMQYDRLIQMMKEF